MPEGGIVGTESSQSDRRIELWYGDTIDLGLRGHPQRAVNILGTVAESEALEALTWRLDDGGALEASVGPDGFRLGGPGDFNIEVPVDRLQEGANPVILTARWRDGSQDRVTVTLHHAIDARWPLPYAVDFTDRGPPDWTSRVQVVDGRWRRTAAGLRTASAHYDRLLTLGDRSWTDYRTTATVIIHDFLLDTPGDLGGGVGLLHRWSGHVPDAFQPHREWRPNGAIGWYRAEWEHRPAACRSLNISDAVVADTMLTDGVPIDLQRERPYVFEFGQRSQPDGPGRYRFRVWPADAPEQLLCDLSTTARVGEAPSGSVLLIALFVDLTVCSIRIDPLVGNLSRLTRPSEILKS